MEKKRKASGFLNFRKVILDGKTLTGYVRLRLLCLVPVLFSEKLTLFRETLTNWNQVLFSPP